MLFQNTGGMQRYQHVTFSVERPWQNSLEYAVSQKEASSEIGSLYYEKFQILYMAEERRPFLIALKNVNFTKKFCFLENFCAK